MSRTTPSPEFDPRIADWLEADPDDAPSPVLETVLAAFPSIPQRHVLRAPWRFLAMNRFAQLAAAASVAVIAIGMVLLVRTGADRTTGAASIDRPASPAVVPSPSSLMPTATPSGSTTPIAISRTDVGRTLDAGTYHVAEFAAPFEITFPADWVVGEFTPNNMSFALNGDGRLSIAFAVVDKIYPDPCHPSSSPRAVGSGVDGVVASFASVKGFEVTSSADVTVGGAAGKAFTLGNSVTAGAGCSRDMLPFATYKKDSASADLSMFPEERDLTWVLDAAGTTVVIFVNDSAASVQASQPVLSLSFDRASSS